jgi:Tfp pilus assembly protein FimT
MWQQQRRSRAAVQGISLLESLFVVVLISILSVVALPKLWDKGTFTLPSQADAAADLVRRGQSLAMTGGIWTRVKVLTSGTNGTIVLQTCAVSGTSCVDHSRFVATHNVSVGALGTDILFNTLGQPVLSNGSATSSDIRVPLSFSFIDPGVPVAPGNLPQVTTQTVSVNVAALTGRVYLGS